MDYKRECGITVCIAGPSPTLMQLQKHEGKVYPDSYGLHLRNEQDIFQYFLGLRIVFVLHGMTSFKK